LASVGILRLEVVGVLLRELKSVFHETAVATFRLPFLVVGYICAVNELLLGELQQRAGRDSVSAFEGSNGGESPARTALSLVLHWVHLAGPVD